MSDPHSRIAEYQQQAEACIAKAESASDDLTRSQFMRLAETYLQLVQMELRRIEIRAPLGTGENLQ